MSKKAAPQIVKSDLSKAQINTNNISAKAAVQAHHHGKGTATDLLDPKEQAIQEDLAILDEEVSDSVADRVILAQTEAASLDAAPAGAGTLQTGGVTAGGVTGESGAAAGEAATGAAAEKAAVSPGIIVALAALGAAAVAAGKSGSSAPPPALDTTAPAAPVINAVATDNIINAAETGVAITGTAEANATVNLSLGGNVRTVTANGAGVWTYTLVGADITAMGQGAETLSATATDAAGNVSVAGTRAITVDTVAPTATAAITAVTDNAGTITGNLMVLPNGNVTNDTSLVLSGTTSVPLVAGEVVAVYDGATRLGTATLGAGNTWTYTDSTLANGNVVSYTVRVEDAAGNRGTASAAFATTIDTAPPLAPAINLVAGNDIINAAEAGSAITGTAEANSTVNLTVGAGNVHTVTANGAGVWSYTLVAADITAMAQGAETLSATATDAAGNVSAAGTRLITVDTAAPAAPAINLVAGNDIINAAEAGSAITGTAEANATVNLTLGGNVRTVAANGAGIWTYTLVAADITAMAQGAETLSATATDAAGNVSAAGTRAIIVDTVGPAAPAINLVAGNDIINAAEAGSAITGSAEANATVNLTVGAGNVHTVTANGAGVWSYTLVAADITAMAQGAETLGATATDAAGNVSAAGTRAITVDTLAPAAPAINLVAGNDIINAAEAGSAITGTAEANATVNLTLGGNVRTVVANGTGVWSYTLVAADITAMAQGAETLSATATDAAGNVSAAGTRAINVDTVAPTVTDANISITSAASGMGGVYIIGDTVTAQWNNAGAGDNNADVASVTMNFSAFGGGVAVAATETAPGSGIWTAGYVIAAGAINNVVGRNVSVTATDTAGNASTVADTTGLTVDNQAPSVTAAITVVADNVGTIQGNLVSGGVTDDTSLVLSGTFTGTLGGDALAVYDGLARLGTATTGVGNTWTYTDATLVNGHTANYTVLGEDAAGNLGAASATFSATIDTVVPTTTSTIDTVIDNYGVNQGPVANGGTTDDTSLVLGGTPSAVLAADEVVAVYDGGARLGLATIGGGRTSWTYTDTTLANGNTANYTVRVEDAAGNQGAASGVYTVNISAPTATAAINQVLDNAAPVTGPLISGGSTNDISLDLSGTITGVLGAGEVVAVYDGATRLGNATVVGSAWTYTDATLANGNAVSYTVVVENAAGDQGLMSTAFTTTIDTAPPAAPVINAVATDNIINAAEAGVAITGTAEANATVNLTVGAGNVRTVTANGAGVWTYTLVGTDITAMGQGAETLSATATDAAGNVSVAGTRAISVDTGVPATPVINAVATDNIINAAETGVAITGTAEANATVNLTVGAGNVRTVTTSGAGTWTYTLVAADITAMGQGAETLSATATDAAGNVSVAGTHAITVDTIVPAAPTPVLAVDTGVAGDLITSNGMVNVTGLEVGASWEYIIDLGAWTAGTGSSVTLAGDGPRSVVVRQTDAAGNVSASSAPLAFALDTTVAQPTLALAADTGAADGITSNGLVNVSGLEAGGTWQYSTDAGGTWTAGTGSSFTLAGDGAKSAIVRQTDVAGNVSVNSAALAYTLDTTAPTAVDAGFTAGTTGFSVNYSESVTAAGTGGVTAFLNSVTALTINGAAFSQTINPNDTITLSYTGTALAATDYVVLNYNATLGSVTDVAGNPVSSGTVVFGGTGTLGATGTTIDLTTNSGSLSYAPVYIRTHQGNDTVTGSSGNDVISTGRGSDTINGSWGADTLNLGEGAAAMDTVVLQQGASGATYYDYINNFDVTSTGGIAANDRLDVRSNNIAASTVGYVDGVNVGTVMSHSIGAGGILTFGSTNAGTPLAVTPTNLADALSYLRTNLTHAGETVAFAADTDGVGGNDALFVYQNAQGWDIVARLDGIPTATLGTAAGTGVVQLWDHTAPEIEGASFAGTAITMNYSENIGYGVGTAGSILKNGAGTNIVTNAVINAADATVLDITTNVGLLQTDWLLMTTGSDFVDMSNNATVANQVFAFGGSGNNTITVTTGMNVNMIMGNAGNDIITATAAAERIEGGTGADTINSGGGADTFRFAQGDSTVVTYLDVGGSGTVNTGDTFTFTGGVDIVNGAVAGSSISLDILSDTSTSMSWAAMSNTGQVGDQQYDAVRGNYAAAVFTVNAAGADMLGIYDGDPTAGVSQTALVLSGGGALTLTPNGDQILIV